MQFSDAFNALYTDVIKPTCERFGLKAIRADDIYKSGLIINDIARSIEEASVIIADVTTDNRTCSMRWVMRMGSRKQPSLER